MIYIVSCCKICSTAGASSDHSDDVGSMHVGCSGLTSQTQAHLFEQSVKNPCRLQNITGLTYSPDDNLWIVDGGCSNLTQLDNVTFTLGEHRFLLRPDQYVLQVQLPRASAQASLSYSAAPLGGAPHWSQPLPIALSDSSRCAISWSNDL